MKILHITNAYPYPDTPEYGVFVKEQIESLSFEGVHNDVFFINGRSSGWKEYVKGIFKVRSIYKDYDIIHCHHLYSALVLMLSFSKGKPVVLSFLNDWLYEVKGFKIDLIKKIVCRAVVARVDRVIFKSPIPEELIGSEKAINLPNGVDDEFFNIKSKDDSKSMLGLDPQNNYILFVSSKNKFRLQKRYDLFKNVLDVLVERRPDLNLKEYVMVGQPRELVPVIFNACSVHVLTSDYEGSPNSVKESLACGVPVVSRNVGNVEDMLKDVPSCVVVNNDADTVAIADEVEKILDSCLDRKAIRNSFIEKGITKKKIARNIVDLYKSMINE